MHIDHDGPRPPYLQLADVLRQRIGAGAIPPGRGIPTETALVAETGLTRSTIRHVVAALATRASSRRFPAAARYVRRTRAWITGAHAEALAASAAERVPAGLGVGMFQVAFGARGPRY